MSISMIFLLPSCRRCCAIKQAHIGVVGNIGEPVQDRRRQDRVDLNSLPVILRTQSQTEFTSTTTHRNVRTHVIIVPCLFDGK